MGEIDIGTTQGGRWLAANRAANVFLWPLTRRYPYLRALPSRS
jgi:hypothetical protein